MLQAAAPARDLLDLLVAVSTIAGGLSLVVIALVLVRGALLARAAAGTAVPALRRLRDDTTPLLRDLSATAANAAGLTAALRSDVARVSTLVEEATAKGHLALDRAERRAREVDTLVRMVQDEATRAMAMAGALTRGVQVGLAALRGDASATGEEEDALDDDEDFDEEYEAPGLAPERPAVRGRRDG